MSKIVPISATAPILRSPCSGCNAGHAATKAGLCNLKNFRRLQRRVRSARDRASHLKNFRPPVPLRRDRLVREPEAFLVAGGPGIERRIPRNAAPRILPPGELFGQPGPHGIFQNVIRDGGKCLVFALLHAQEEEVPVVEHQHIRGAYQAIPAANMHEQFPQPQMQKRIQPARRPCVHRNRPGNRRTPAVARRIQPRQPSHFPRLHPRHPRRRSPAWTSKNLGFSATPAIRPTPRVAEI